MYVIQVEIRYSIVSNFQSFSLLKIILNIYMSVARISWHEKRGFISFLMSTNVSGSSKLSFSIPENTTPIKVDKG